MTTERKKLLFELFTGHAADTLTAEEHTELQAALRTDAGARQLWFVHQDVEMGLRAHLVAMPAEVVWAAPTRRWLNWRPLWAAAAGLVFGIFGASVVWALAVPSVGRTIERKVTVLAESFEDEKLMPGRGFPTDANRWSGDVSAPVGAESGVMPSEGRRMVRLTHPPKRKLGYAWRIVDLAEHPEAATAKSLRLEVTASFNTSGPARPSRNQIRLAAFSQEPSAVREIWNNEPVLFDSVLQHVSRNVLTKADDPGWKTVNAVMEIPPGTRSVVISLAAGDVDSAPPLAEHYLDDVRARFVITQAPVE